MTRHFDVVGTEAAATESSWTTDDGLRFTLSVVPEGAIRSVLSQT